MDKLVVLKGINCWSVHHLKLKQDTQLWIRLGYRATYKEAIKWVNDICSGVETSEVPKQEDAYDNYISERYENG
jgi:phage/plasmid-associated DNA primase